MKSNKSQFIAKVLCIFGGYLGLHYFYVRRYWRGALNLFLMLALFISSNVFGLRYFYVSFNRLPDVHWREIVSVASAAIVGITWILDIVFICKGKFKDDKGLYLK